MENFDNSTNSTAHRNTNNIGELSQDDGKQHRAWIITWNNYTEEDVEWFKKYCEGRCNKFRWQLEVGKDGKTPHIQGALLFASGRSFNAVKKDLPKCHIEFSNNWRRIKNYCSKNDTSTGVFGESEAKPRFKFEIKDILNDRSLYPWQNTILNIIESNPDDRRIYWFWDENGNIGKTALARHVCIKDPNALYLTGKASDMKYGVFCAVENGINVSKVLLDFTRSTEQFISYQGIEEIKNGIFYNTKYESKMCIFNPPNIVCFANFPPIKEKLSLDRWEIIDLTPMVKKWKDKEIKKLLCN